VEVTFDIDANGIVSVSAKDKASGKTQTVRIEASTALSKDEIEKLKQEAAAHATEDAQKKELIEAKNQAEQLIYVSEKALKDAGDKVPADVKSAVSAKIDTIKGAKDGSDVAAIKTATEALSQELQKIGSAMYGKGGEASAEGEAPKPEEPKA